jgi:tRNA threonylcarbamoyladenosine biosynthesis protein TsaB
MPDVLILSLETSTSVCSVALHNNEKLLAAVEIHKDQSHASKLAPLIDQVLTLADVDRKDLGAVAVTAGPGSYTGLRIGTSTAKGLCMALNIPLVSVGTLEVMAVSLQGTLLPDALLCPMIDARRMEVYCQLFTSSHKQITDVEAKVIDGESFQSELKNRKIIFFGNGAPKCKTVLIDSNAFFIDDIIPSATALGTLAYKKYQQGKMENLVTFEPFYLKEFMIKTPAQ